MATKPAPKATIGCNNCIYKIGDFFDDKENEGVIRCYCNARHANVDAELMSKTCDFFKRDPEITLTPRPKVKGI